MSDGGDDELAAEPRLPAWLATEKATTNGRRLATSLASGAAGILIGMISVPDRALDVPVEAETQYGSETIYEAVYYPIDPTTITVVLLVVALAIVLWHVFDTEAADEAGDDQ